jgi:hypothetical protein
VDYELTAERQMISKRFIRIFYARSGGDQQVAQHQQGNDNNLHDTSP